VDDGKNEAALGLREDTATAETDVPAPTKGGGDSSGIGGADGPSGGWQDAVVPAEPTTDAEVAAAGDGAPTAWAAASEPGWVGCAHALSFLSSRNLSIHI
jgi:hypothetical protein